MKFLWLILAFMVHGCACPGLAWNQANSKVLQVDQGSGISSVPNYWKSGDAEVTLTGVAAYADAVSAKPVDCAGGSPAITVARSETAPMYDKQSWLITKPVGDLRGQGVAFEFDVDNGIAAVEMMDLMFEYIVGSGTFDAGSDTTNSDLMVYLYDVTAGKLIEPKGGSKLYTSSTTVKGDYRGWFQSTLGSKKYRVCLHQATTAASAYTLKVDAGKVQKSKHVTGTIITEWQSYTPTITSGAGTIAATLNGRWRRVGDSAEVKNEYIYTSGTGTGAGFTLSLPTGLTIDTTKIFASAVLGSGYYYNPTVGFLNTDTRASGNSINFTKNAVNNIILGTDADEAGSSISVSLTVPIQGWSAGARMSDGYAFNPATLGVYRTISNQTGVNPNVSRVKIQLNGLGVNNLDTIGCWDYINFRCNIKTSGVYDIGAAVAVSGINVLNVDYVLQLVVNGSTSYALDSAIPPAGSFFTLKGQINIPLNAGDYVELYLFGNGNNSTNTLTITTGNTTRLLISKQMGIPIMSPTALWETHYAGTAGDAIGTSDSLIKFTTKIEDTFGSYNPSTGLWTAKGPATCSFAVRLGTASVNLSTSQNFFATLYKNGSIYRVGNAPVGNGVANTYQSIVPVVSEKVSTGDTYSVYGRSGVATTSTTAESGAYFTVSCRQ
nr:hypothetical protein BdHM001_18360 [Bdellovibrio sp. HM001]